MYEPLLAVLGFGGWELLLILILLAVPLAILVGIRLLTRRSRETRSSSGAPPPLHPGSSPAAPQDTPSKKTARVMVMLSQILAGLGVVLLAGAVYVFMTSSSSGAAGILVLVGFVLLVVAAVIGQIGRGMQGRVL